MRTLVSKKSKIYFLFTAFLFFILVSCGDNKFEANNPEDHETYNSGKLEIYVDDAIADVMDSVFTMYKAERITNVDLKVHIVNAREAMVKLLARESRLVMLARDYLNDEDSLMKLNGLKPHRKFIPASEALVFFVNKNSKLDTLNHKEVVSFLTDSGYNLSEKFNLSEQLTLLSRDIQTSEFATLKNIIGSEANLKKEIIYINKTDSLITLVENNKSYMGVALYSKIMKNDKVKPLRIGYSDSTGKWISPKPIHPGWFLQNLYPYRVFYNIYLLEDKRNLAFWFSQYCATERKVVQYYQRYGIVPEYAKFKLHINK